MKKTILNLLILVSLNSCGQNLKCSDFHQGNFTLTSFGTTPMVSKVVRNENEHIETIIELPEELKDLDIPTRYYAKIEWITECSYKMTYDETKMELNPILSSYNKSGGILVKLIEIKENCFYYKSIFKLDGQTIELNGKLCKE